MMNKLHVLYAVVLSTLQNMSKGQIAGLTVSAKQLVIFGIFMVVGVSIFAGMNFETDSAAANITAAILSAFNDFVGWLPTIVIIIAAAVMLYYTGAFGR
jgi:hypothetical protein